MDADLIGLCEHCGSPMVGRRRRFCNGECRRRSTYVRTMGRPAESWSRSECEVCRATLTRHARRWCSRRCRTLSAATTERIRTCEVCGSEYKRTRGRQRSCGLEACTREVWRQGREQYRRRRGVLPRSERVALVRSAADARREKVRERRRALRAEKSAARAARMEARRWSPRSLPCANCGYRFMQAQPRQKYCTQQCQQHRVRRRRGRKVRRQSQKWVLLFRRQLGRCTWCGDRLREEYLGSECHIDHVLPRALGGGNELANLAALHATCNLSKGSSLVQGGLRVTF